MKNFLLVTVDCDLRCNDVSLRQKSLDVLLGVFAEMRAAGHITWFVNENDFALTRNHESFLSEAIQRGDTLGVHDHFQRFKGRYERSSIRQFCRRSKKTLQEWLAQNGRNHEVIFHRNGSLVQHPAIYGKLKKLGYRVVSEVWPGQQGLDRDGYPAFDNRSIPAGIMPYRHDEENFQDYRSTKGHFLHVPIMHMRMVDLDFIQMKHWLELFASHSLDSGVLVWLFHPYEILNDDHTNISLERTQVLKSYLDKCRAEFKLTLANMEEFLSEFKIVFEKGER